MSRAHRTHIETAYRKALDNDEIVADEAQARGVSSLARLERELVGKQPFWRKRKARGVYLYGPVGRGKTWLMDLFFHALPIDAKLRLHFHVFMHEEVHAPLKKLAGERDPLVKVARELARRLRVICFDEFLVEDITDAMLLGTLFEALFAEGVALVATSNVAPDDLYRDGLQRERFLPAIAAIKTHCEVVDVAGETDHRAARIGAEGVWRTTSSADLPDLFHRLTHTEPERGELRINHRPIHYLGASEDTLLMRFNDLCDGPRSAEDYLELAQRYHVIMLEGIPILDDKRLGAARRFIALVDILYESHTLLIASAASPPESLYSGKRLRFEFKRTASRLEEMRSTDWLAAHHLSHARALTPL
jgi:cell division protein ZapE